MRQLEVFPINEFRTHKRDNTPENQVYLEKNRERLSNQNQLVWDILCRGERLTCRRAMIEYNIGDLRRRIKDLKDTGHDIDSIWLKGRFKEYFKAEIL